MVLQTPEELRKLVTDARDDTFLSNHLADIPHNNSNLRRSIVLVLFARAVSLWIKDILHRGDPELTKWLEGVFDGQAELVEKFKTKELLRVRRAETDDEKSLKLFWVKVADAESVHLGRSAATFITPERLKFED